MNNKTICIYNLAKAMEHIDEINIVRARYGSVHEMISNRDNKYIINMCLVQIGEHMRNIRDKADHEFLNQIDLSIEEISGYIGMRNRIVHGYSVIDYELIEKCISEDIPKLHREIAQNIHADILCDPYILYETEYEDFIKNKTVPPGFTQEPLLEDALYENRKKEEIRQNHCDKQR